MLKAFIYMREINKVSRETQINSCKSNYPMDKYEPGIFLCSACLKYKSLYAEYTIIRHIYFNCGSVLIVEETELQIN